MIPHVAPPIWPEASPRPGRFAATVVQNAPELSEDPVERGPQGSAEKCSVALIGLPDDTGVEMNAGRIGAAEGPHAFRAALARYGVAAPMADKEGGGSTSGLPRVFDVGDVVPAMTIEETHARVTEAVKAVVESGLFPIAIGGGHDLTFPFVRGVAEGLGIKAFSGVYFDAHLDVRPQTGSGMAFRALSELGLAKQLICVGLDPFSNSAEHAEYFRSIAGSTVPFEPALWPSVVRGENVFVSLDLDVLDAAYAPGVSAMNPCGMNPAQICAYLEAAGRDKRVRCFDIMELSPRHDEHGRTARLAAALFLRFLRAFTDRS